jgi:hypothetical protein
MAPDDAATFAALPETLRLYRDQDDLTRVALSWRLGEGAGEERRREGFFIEAKKRPRPLSLVSTGPKPKPRFCSLATETPPRYHDAHILGSIIFWDGI